MLKTTMFGSNRRPFALTVPGIAILILLAGLLWVGSGYKPVSADPLIPPNQVVYTPTFSTANQSKWGPGINVPPATVLSLFDQSWSAGGNTEYKVNFGGDIDFEGYTIPIPSGTFGGAIGGSTTGHIALGMEFRDFGAGGVDVTYPIESTITSPGDDSFGLGDTVTIYSTSRVLPGAELSTVSPSLGTVALTGTVGFTLGMNAEACIYTCAGFTVPTFGISPEVSGDIIAIDVPNRVNLDSYEIAESMVNGTIPAEVEAMVRGIITDSVYEYLLNKGVSEVATIIDNATPLGTFGGYVGLPDLDTTSELDADGTTLIASGEHDFVEIEVDLTGYFPSAPTGFELFPLCIGGFCAGFSVDIAAITSTTSLTQEEEYELDARPRVKLQFPQPVTYSINSCVPDSFSNIDPSNPTAPVDVVTCSGTSNTVIFDLGSSVNITFPASFSGASMNVTPTFLLPNLLSNDTVTTLTEAVSAEAGSLSLELSAIELVPPFEIIPEACIPYVGCTPALVFPGFSTDEIDIEEGPLYEQTYAEVSISNDSIFDGNIAPWILEGFNTPQALPSN